MNAVQNYIISIRKDKRIQITYSYTVKNKHLSRERVDSIKGSVYNMNVFDYIYPQLNTRLNKSTPKVLVVPNTFKVQACKAWWEMDQSC